MATLYARLQEIIGEKIFRHKVTFDGDVVFKKHITAYAPVPSEPSLGTPHPHIDLTLVTAVPGNNNVQVTAVPGWVVGTKTIEGEFGLVATADVAILIYDTSGTYIIRRQYAQVAGVNSFGYFKAPIDSSGNLRWAVTNFALTTGILITRSFYDI
jgi:hypothetical protein